jgi:hypothetical protein
LTVPEFMLLRAHKSEHELRCAYLLTIPTSEI